MHQCARGAPPRPVRRRMEPDDMLAHQRLEVELSAARKRRAAARGEKGASYRGVGLMRGLDAEQMV
eukprot:scaffold11986_cov127-Isochrysis_galbana.AAC.3